MPATPLRDARRCQPPGIQQIYDTEKRHSSNPLAKPALTAPAGFRITAAAATQNMLSVVEGGGFEPPKLSRQIYSLIPLATREPLQKAAYSADGPMPCQPPF